MYRQITQEETQKLFQFCRDHFVYHYDVQIELVDHLASSIEEQWSLDPDISFEQALHTTFRKFGVTGFSKVKVEKEKALSKKYNRLLGKYLLEFYQFPKIVMTFAFTLVLYTLLKITANELWILVPYFGLLTLAIILYYYKIYPKHFKIETIPGKSFMLLNQLKQVQYFAIFTVNIPIQAVNFWNMIRYELLATNLGLIIISFLIILFTIACYGQLMYVPQKVKEHFMDQYAEFAK